MPSTTQAQINAHQIAVAAAEGEKQRALAAAKAAYSGSAVAWGMRNAAVLTADIQYVKSLMASYQLNSLGTGPSRTLHELIGQDT